MRHSKAFAIVLQTRKPQRHPHTRTHTHIRGQSSYLRPYLQGFEDNHGGARGTGGVVVQELLQARLQATEVSGGAEGLGASVLDRAEGFWEATQLPEALQQEPVDRLRCLTFSGQGGGSLQMELGQQVSQNLVVILFISPWQQQRLLCKTVFQVTIT